MDPSVSGNVSRRNVSSSSALASEKLSGSVVPVVTGGCVTGSVSGCTDVASAGGRVSDCGAVVSPGAADRVQETSSAAARQKSSFYHARYSLSRKPPPGADFAVLSADPLAVCPEDLRSPRVEAALKAGKRIFAAG